MLRVSIVLFALLFSAVSVFAQEKTVVSKHTVELGLMQACRFFSERVSSHGGYVYYRSADLKQSWGEGKVPAASVVVQPPGTPAVGQAFLRVYAATGDKDVLEAAVKAGDALVAGQLQSGGWDQVIYFEDAPRRGKYRNGPGGKWNSSSLDDGQTQSALEFLMRLDHVLQFKNAKIHDAAEYGMNALLKAQYANGAFPQVWTGPVPVQPVMTARYPDYDWKTEGRVKDYWNYYTLNDGLAGTVAKTLLTAHEVYRDEKYLVSLKKHGDFLIKAQMPEPQPGWCQQYNFEMVPIWARKFEPPAITGWECQDVMETLILIYQRTGDQKYLEPIPRALKYYQTCLLPDGKIARYYELKTNRPLYMDLNYQLTYDDSSVPPHYGWKQSTRFDEIARKLQEVQAGRSVAVPKRRQVAGKHVEQVLKDLDSQGRWVSTFRGEKLVGQPKFPEGFQFISSEVFCNNVDVLCDYLETQRAEK